MYRPTGQGASRLPPQQPPAYENLTRHQGGYKPLLPAGQPISVPTPYGQGPHDRTFEFSSPQKSQEYNGGAGRGGGGGGGQYRGGNNGGNYGNGRTWGQPRQHNQHWNNSASLNGNSSNYSRGSEGFYQGASTSTSVSRLVDDGDDWRIDPNEKKPTGAGADVDKHRMAALQRSRLPPPPASSASTSSFYGHNAPLPVDSPGKKAEKQRALEVGAKSNDPEAVERREAASRQEAARKAEAMRKARSSSNERPAAPLAPVFKGTFEKLKEEAKRKKSTGSTESDKTSKDRSRTTSRDRSAEVLPKKLDKGKGKARYLDEAADDGPPKKRHSTGGSSLAKFRGSGFDDDDDDDSRSSTPRASSSSKQRKKGDKRRRSTPDMDVVSLEDQFRQAMEQEAKTEPMILDDMSEEDEDAADSDEDDPLLRKAAYVDPDTLCPFCDNPLPPEPSADLLSLREYLISRPEAEPWPTVDNPKHVRIDPKQRAGFCKRHRDEAEVIPEGRARGWPEEIDWDDVARRIKRDCADHLQEVIFGNVSSDYLDRARVDAREKGKKLNDVKSDWSSFELEQPGYYGHRGYVVLLRTLTDLFTNDRPVLTSFRTNPLPIDYYLRRVLIPECAISLIQDDMDLPTRGHAAKVMQESRQYGRAMFGDEDEDEREWAKRERQGDMERERREREREERDEYATGSSSGSGDSDAEVAALLTPAKVKNKVILDLDGSSSEDGDVEPVPSKPVGRKPKALVQAEEAEAAAAKKGKAKQQRVEDSEDDLPSPPPPKKAPKDKPRTAITSIASSTTSTASSRTSKSTRITIPSSGEGSGSDDEVTVSQPSSAKKPAASKSKSSSSSSSKSKELEKAKKGNGKPSANDISALFAKQDKQASSDRGPFSSSSSKPKPLSASSKSKTKSKDDDKSKKKEEKQGSLLRPASPPSSDSDPTATAIALSSEDELLASDNEISTNFRATNRKKDKQAKERKKADAKRKRVKAGMRRKGQAVESSSDDD